MVFSESSSPFTYSRRELPSATHARCTHLCSGMKELDQRRSPLGCDVSVVETKNSTPRVSGSRKMIGVRSSSVVPLCSTVRQSPVESCRRYIHISTVNVLPASVYFWWLRIST